MRADAAQGGVATLLLLGLLAAGPAVAQAPAHSAPAAPAVLTLDDAIRIALDKNRDIEKARAYQRWVQGRYVEERAAALPRLAVDGAYTRAWDGTYSSLFADLVPPDQTTRLAGLSVSQTLFSWGKVGAAVRAAEHGIMAAEDQLEHFRQAAVRDVTEAFYDVLLARRLEEIAREALALRERQLAEAEGRQGLGTATDYDVLAARVALDNQRPEVLRTANLVATMLDRLRLVLAEESLAIDVTGSLEAEAAPEPLPALDEAIATALEHRPDLRGMGHGLDVYREVVKIRAAGNKPSLELRGGAGWKWLDAGPIAADGETWSAGVFLAFPFFDGLATQGRTAAAQADLDRAELDYLQARDALVVEVRTALDAVAVAAEIVRGLAGTVEQARRLLQMSEQGLALGVKTRLDVDSALLDARSAEANLAAARRQYLVALTQLRYAQGTL